MTLPTLRTRCTLSTLLLLALALPFAALAQPASLGDDDVASLRRHLETEWQRVLDGRERVARAEHAVRDSRQRKYPRGEKRVELYDELEAAREDLAALEAQWPDKVEQARQAGLPAGVLQEFEDRL